MKATNRNVDVDIFQVQEILPPETLEAIKAPPKPDIPFITSKDLPQYDGFVFGVPTRFGMAPSQIKNLLDSTGAQWATNALSGKLATVFTCSSTQHGGQETTILSMLPFFCHHGISFMPLGYSHPALQDTNELVGGSCYGAGSITGGDGSRLPTEKELSIAAKQGYLFAEAVSNAVVGAHHHKMFASGAKTVPVAVAAAAANAPAATNTVTTTSPSPSPAQPSDVALGKKSADIARPVIPEKDLPLAPTPAIDVPAADQQTVMVGANNPAINATTMSDAVAAEAPAAGTLGTPNETVNGNGDTLSRAKSKKLQKRKSIFKKIF